MPNHYQVVGLFAVDWEKLEELGLDEPNVDALNGVNLCELCNPLPEDLKGIVSASVPSRYRNTKTGEWWTKDNNGPIRESGWEMVELTIDERLELIEKHGAADWYEYQVKEWGTKWGTYKTAAKVLGGDGLPVCIEFQSAWGPPSPKMMGKINAYLHENYGLLNGMWIGHDPSDGFTYSVQAVSI